MLRVLVKANAAMTSLLDPDVYSAFLAAAADMPGTFAPTRCVGVL